MAQLALLSCKLSFFITPDRSASTFILKTVTAYTIIL